MHIKNWPKFQHFKDRRPPWIKLYRDILDDDEWFSLPPTSAKVLVSLWLLASEDKNRAGELPTMKKISFRLRITEKALESAISDLDHWLIQDDINLTSARHQLGSSETEIKAEAEAKAETLSDSFPEQGSSLESAPSVSLTSTNNPDPDLKSKIRVKKKKALVPVDVRGTLAWETYTLAYERRYGVAPVRNAMVNAMMGNLVRKLGDEAVSVAGYYPTHNNPYYVAKRHPVGAMLSDAEGLRTQWATGVRATRGEAKNAEQRDDVREQITRVEAMLEKKGGL